MGKKKGKKKKKGDVVDKDNDPEYILKDFLRQYDKACKAQETEMCVAIQQQFKKILNDDEITLSLSNIKFPIIASDANIGPLGVKCLLDGLQYSRYSKFFYNLAFWKVGIKDEGLALLGDFLIKDCLITTLEVTDNNITAKGCIALKNMLKNNETLKILRLDFNDIGDDGAIALGDGLKWNSGLVELSLQFCNIGPEGGRAIGVDILKHSKIQKLNLQGNHLEPDGVSALSTALGKNTSLTYLNIADNAFGHDLDCIGNLQEGLKANSTLKELNMHFNVLVEGGPELLLEVMKEKKNIEKLQLYEKMDKTIFNELLSTVKGHKPGKSKKKGKKKRKEKEVVPL